MRSQTPRADLPASAPVACAGEQAHQAQSSTANGAAPVRFERERVAAGVPGLALLRVWGAPSGDVWATGLAGIILRRSSTGWVSEESPTTVDLWALWGTAPENMWAAGSTPDRREAVVIRRGKGGWRRDMTFPSVAFEPGAFFGTGADNLWVVGARVPAIYHRDASGWTPVANPHAQGIFTAACGDSVALHAVGADGRVASREAVLDGNLEDRWLSENAGTRATLRGIRGGRAEMAVVGDEGFVALKRDGAWKIEKSPDWEGRTLQGIWGEPENFWIVGERGTIIHRFTEKWTRADPEVAANLYGIWGRGWDVWAVGDDATVLHAYVGPPPHGAMTK